MQAGTSIIVGLDQDRMTLVLSILPQLTIEVAGIREHPPVMELNRRRHGVIDDDQTEILRFPWFQCRWAEHLAARAGLGVRSPHSHTGRDWRDT